MSTIASKRRIEKYEKAEFGFWLYLLTDIILFASLFATYMILRNNTASGETAGELLNPHYALLLTVILLVSSFTSGVAMLCLRFKMVRKALVLLALTLLLGITFVFLEISEFINLVHEGQSWQTSAFLSGFFTLVATHGLHITLGSVWGGALFFYIKKVGANANSVRKFTLFSLFWHFLDLVWIFIFTIVYLGATL